MNLLNLIQCIGDGAGARNWPKLEAFKRGLASFEGKSLQALRDIWSQFLEADDDEGTQVHKFFTFGLDHLALSSQLVAERDGPWMA